MPRNFCWIIPNKLAGISKLRGVNDILGLQAIGIYDAYFFLEKRYFDDIVVPVPMSKVEDGGASILRSSSTSGSDMNASNASTTTTSTDTGTGTNATTAPLKSILSIKSTKSWTLSYIPCDNEKTPLLQDMENVLCSPTVRPTVRPTTTATATGTASAPVVFGCLGGFGRTGTALACYLVKYGLDCDTSTNASTSTSTTNTTSRGPAMAPNEAISYLRRIRPKSIENAIQLSYVHQYCNYLYSKMEFDDEDYSNNSGGGNTNIKLLKPSTKHPKISKQTTKIKFIMLVGLPAAGKSTFCELFTSCDLQCTLLNQDQLGRNECESTLVQSLKESDIVLLDRTNLTITERKSWLELSMLEKEQCLCVVLTTPSFICKDRAKIRINHPTIKTGGGGRIINDAEKKFELPLVSEGFSEVVYLEDTEDVRNYLKTWNCSQIELRNQPINANHNHSNHNNTVNYDNNTNCNSNTNTNANSNTNSNSNTNTNTNPHRIELIKFPRTQHLFNLGSASRDDLLVQDEDVDKLLGMGVGVGCNSTGNSTGNNNSNINSSINRVELELEITEKVDGAQLGFSIDPTTYKIRAQNRSHYVNSKSHSQFQYLDKFIHIHQESLYSILGDDSCILYGEWLYAKHSVGYVEYV